MKVRTFALTLALLACGTAASAADNNSDYIKPDAPKGISDAFYACVDKAGSDHTVVANCLMNEKQKQDARLNSTYKTLMGKLDAKGKEKLLTAERSWLDLQDKTGRLEDTLYGNESVGNLQRAQNDTFRICERANVLQKYLAVLDLK